MASPRDAISGTFPITKQSIAYLSDSGEETNHAHDSTQSTSKAASRSEVNDVSYSGPESDEDVDVFFEHGQRRKRTKNAKLRASSKRKINPTWPRPSPPPSTSTARPRLPSYATERSQYPWSASTSVTQEHEGGLLVDDDDLESQAPSDKDDTTVENDDPGRRFESPSEPSIDSQEPANTPQSVESKVLEKPSRAPVFAPLFDKPASQSQYSQSSQSSSSSITTSQNKTGCIYVFHDDQTNHVKIGMTTSLKRRLAEVQRKCQKPHLTLEWQTGDTIPEKELKQLEKIVHWDLEKFNKKYICSCRTQHNEWFDVEIREARRTIEMWLRYQRLNPGLVLRDVQRLRVGYPLAKGSTWLGRGPSLDHVKRYEFWHLKLFGEVYDESFPEE